jgi:hypothetical protein
MQQPRGGLLRVLVDFNDGSQLRSDLHARVHVVASAHAKGGDGRLRLVYQPHC